MIEICENLNGIEPGYCQAKLKTFHPEIVGKNTNMHQNLQLAIFMSYNKTAGKQSAMSNKIERTRNL